MRILVLRLGVILFTTIIFTYFFFSKILECSRHTSDHDYKVSLTRLHFFFSFLNCKNLNGHRKNRKRKIFQVSIFSFIFLAFFLHLFIFTIFLFYIWNLKKKLFWVSQTLWNHFNLFVQFATLQLSIVHCSLSLIYLFMYFLMAFRRHKDNKQHEQITYLISWIETNIWGRDVGRNIVLLLYIFPGGGMVLLFIALKSTS